MRTSSIRQALPKAWKNPVANCLRIFRIAIEIFPKKAIFHNYAANEHESESEHCRHCPPRSEHQRTANRSDQARKVAWMTHKPIRPFRDQMVPALGLNSNDRRE